MQNLSALLPQPPQKTKFSNLKRGGVFVDSKLENYLKCLECAISYNCVYYTLMHFNSIKLKENY